MSELIEEIAKVHLFSSLPRRHLKRIAALMELRDVAKGDELVHEGEFSREFYVILSGAAAVSVRGRKRDTLGSREFFGEIAILNRSARSATVSALSAMRVAVVDARDFQRLLENEPRMALHMLQHVARRFEHLTRKPLAQLK